LSNYRKGRRYEYSVKQKLEELGWTVWRLAGSKPVDLIAFRAHKDRPTEIAVIECKNYFNISVSEIRHCMKVSAAINMPVLLIRPLPTVRGSHTVTVITKYGKRQVTFLEQYFK